MYVTIFLLCNPYLLKYIFSEPQNCEISGEINVEMCIIEKARKSIAKKL